MAATGPFSDSAFRIRLQAYMKRAATSEQSCARKSVVNLSQTAEHFSSDSKYFPRLLQKSYLYDLEADREIIAPLHFVAQGFPFPQLAPPECSRFFPFPSIVSLMAPTQTEADGDDMLSDGSMRAITGLSFHWACMGSLLLFGWSSATVRSEEQ